MNDYQFIMVLNDGETFTGMEDCAIYKVPSEWTSDVIEKSLGNLMPVAWFAVNADNQPTIVTKVTVEKEIL